MSAKSLLYAAIPPLSLPALCAPGRQEVKATIMKDGRLYHLTLRDKIIPEDPYLVLVKAAAFAVKLNEPYMGRIVPRDVKDFLIKSNAIIG
jgi:hypothetical protein